MHYYEFNIGSYKKRTEHLTDDEDLAYRRLLDLYYDTDGNIPTETQSVSRRLRMTEKHQAVENVLNEFFPLINGKFTNPSADERILKYKKKQKTNKINGKKGGRPKNPVANRTLTDIKANAKATNKQEPITNISDTSVSDSANLFPQN